MRGIQAQENKLSCVKSFFKKGERQIGWVISFKGESFIFDFVPGSIAVGMEYFLQILKTNSPTSCYYYVHTTRKKWMIDLCKSENENL